VEKVKPEPWKMIVKSAVLQKQAAPYRLTGGAQRHKAGDFFKNHQGRKMIFQGNRQKKLSRGHSGLPVVSLVISSKERARFLRRKQSGVIVLRPV
jgi:hypothetical protein